MTRKIEWLDNFAESFAKSVKMEKRASRLEKQSIIVDRSVVKEAKLGDVIKYENKFYKVADLDFVDEKGEGAVLDEVDSTSPYAGIEDDPMSVSMGTDAAPFAGQQKPQEYSRVDPGDVYNIDVPENYEQAAEETARQIEQDKSVDRSTVPGHYTNPDTTMNSSTPISTEIPSEPTSVLMDAPVSDPVSEIPSDVPTDTPTDVPAETPGEVVEDIPSDVSEEENSEEDESAEDITDEEIEKAKAEAVASKSYNRILRRIMASRK